MESGKIKVTTKQQFEKLVELMEKYPETGRGKAQVGTTKNKSRELWEEFALELNSLGPPSRTAQEWGRVWVHYKANLKRKLANNRNTGVGPSHVVSLNPLEKSVAKLIKIREQVSPAGRSFGVENIFPAVSNYETEDNPVPSSMACPGTPAVKVEFETEEATAKDVTESLGHETTFEEDFVEHENLPSDDEDAENEENSGMCDLLIPDPSRPENFEKTNTASRKRIIRERPENIKRTKPASVIIEDPLDENQTSIKDDNFEQWALKKKQLLEIELLEMRNYKFKLELLEIEQRLKLAPSKFTRSIRSVE